MIGCKVVRTLASVEIKFILILGLPCWLSSSIMRCLKNVDEAQSSRVPVPLPKDPYEAIRMSTLVFVNPEISTQVDEAQSSRVPVPLPKDPYEAIRLAMSSDNAQSVVTYTSISSDSDRPSWAWPKDDDEDLEEDPNKEHELEDEDTKETSKGSDVTKPFEEDEAAVTPSPTRHRGARISVRPQTPMAAFTQALIDAFAAGSSPFPLPPTNHAYDQAPLGHRTAMIRIRDDILEKDMPPWRRFILTAPPHGCDVAESSAAATRAPRSQYDFVNTVEAGQGLIRGHDAQTIDKAADRAEDVGYVRALQASEQRMMTSIKEVNLRTDRRDIRLEIDVVRGQRTAYETKLQEVQQAYLSSEAQNKALLA
nr:hypothetical protein [Tanacetum cinerariifolium]